MIRSKNILMLVMLLFCGVQSQASMQNKQKETLPPWYVGMKGGVSFGASTFTAFGADRTRAGFNVGVLGGYNFNSIFSVEFSASFGKMGLSLPRSGGNYWMGMDGVSYSVPVEWMMGKYYSNIYSSVAVQQYGLQANVSLIPLYDHFFGTRTNSRFSVMISPAIYGVGTRATIKNISGGEQFIKQNRQFNFGVGGDISVGYELTKNLTARLSSGVNRVLGAQFDGIPAGETNRNLIWNNNASLVWRFGKRDRKQRSAVRAPYIVVENRQSKPKTPMAVEKAEVTMAVEKTEVLALTERIEIKAENNQGKQITFPSVYFAFNSVEVKASQMKAITEIVELLNENPEVAVIITGFTDKYGSLEVNRTYAQRRAKAIQVLLIRRGVIPERIKAIGVGVDLNAETTKEARRVDITQWVNNETEGGEIYFPSIYFSFMSDVVSPSQMIIVDKIVQILKNNPETKISLTGFTNRDGADDVMSKYAQRRRAKVIQKLLIEKGVETSRIDNVGTAVDATTNLASEGRRIGISIDTPTDTMKNPAAAEKEVNQNRTESLQTLLVDRGVNTARIRIADENEENNIKQKPERNIAFPSLFFEGDNSTISTKQILVVEQIVYLLNAYPKVSVVVTGFSDRYGSENVKQKYSQKRAETLKTLLIERGIDASRIRAVGAGEDRNAKIAPDARRVDVNQDMKTKQSGGEIVDANRSSGLAPSEAVDSCDSKEVASAKSVYTVKPGDTLSEIAERHGTTLTKLCALNNINRNSLLQLGQRLKVQLNRNGVR